MKPEINVTPLIDVLLVLLIIFMGVSPLAPSRFETKIPGENKDPVGRGIIAFYPNCKNEQGSHSFTEWLIRSRDS